MILRGGEGCCAWDRLWLHILSIMKKGIAMDGKQNKYEVTIEYGDKELLKCIENILNSLAEKNGYSVEKFKVQGWEGRNN